jgi:hypothetical protein
MAYQPNEPLTIYVVGGFRVTYRDVLVYSSGANGLVLVDNRTSETLKVAFDPANPNQDFRMTIEKRRSRVETEQRAKEIWSLERYRSLLKEARRMLSDATTGEGTARQYLSPFFDEEEPPKSFSEYWNKKIAMKPEEPEVINATGEPVDHQLRPIKGTARRT